MTNKDISVPRERDEVIDAAFATLGADHWFHKYEAVRDELQQVKRDHMADVRHLNAEVALWERLSDERGKALWAIGEGIWNEPRGNDTGKTTFISAEEFARNALRPKDPQ